MSWDQRYRPLREGEIIQAADEYMFDDGTWGSPGPTVGTPAPDPAYTAHRWYRRLKGAQP